MPTKAPWVICVYKFMNTLTEIGPLYTGKAIHYSVCAQAKLVLHVNRNPFQEYSASTIVRTSLGKLPDTQSTFTTNLPAWLYLNYRLIWKLIELVEAQHSLTELNNEHSLLNRDSNDTCLR